MKRLSKVTSLFAGASLLTVTGTTDTRVFAEEVLQLVNATTESSNVVEKSEAIKTPATVEEAQTQLDQASAGVKEADQTLDEAKTSVETASTELTEAENAVTENETVITDTTKTIDETTSEIAVVETNLEEAETELQELEAANPDASSKLQNAELTVENAEVEAEKAKDAETQAKAVEASAQKELSEAQTLKANFEQALASAQSKEQSTKSAVESAENAVETAVNNLQSKETEVATKIEELKENVVKAGEPTLIEIRKVQTGITTDGKNSLSAQKVRDKAKADPSNPKYAVALSREEVIFSGKETVDVQISDAQLKELKETGEFSYEVNVKKIAEHMVNYINQLRELNGINKKLVITDEMMNYAAARANEMLANDRMSHATKLQRASTRENIGRGIIIKTNMSEQQFAYEAVFSYFSEYAAVSDTYGHRLAMLFEGTEFGFDYADRKFATDNYHYFESQQFKGEPDTTLWGNVTTKDENGVVTQCFKGKRFVFLPEYSFNYVGTEKVPVENKAYTTAVKALESYEAKSTEELSNLSAVARAAKNKLAAANQEHTSAKTELEKLMAKGNGEAAVKEAELKLENATAKRKEAENSVRKTVQNLLEAKSALNQLEKQFQVIADAKNNVETAKTELESAKANLEKLQSVKTEAELKLENAFSKKDELLETLAEKTKNHEDAKKVYEKAMADFGEAQKRFLTAQANLLKLQDSVKVTLPSVDGPSSNNIGSDDNSSAGDIGLDKKDVDLKSDKSQIDDNKSDTKDKTDTQSQVVNTTVSSKTTPTTVAGDTTTKTGEKSVSAVSSVASRAFVSATKNDRRLPETGEHHRGLLTILGIGLVFASLGLGRRRSRP